ncbi:hypothetical protein [Streptomyces rhizosphaericus]|uniref:Uncharacterized protein n=1 Tax=Streptomyces rhizosphaericus TaxID=114699 RepID=A0A6G4ARY8_9ACTN|nr:hypothetical protein [Streptomyces rhizosphaericus]NEW75544.1 hypothetical protein [Streptomyces rhizosphaericus]
MPASEEQAGAPFLSVESVSAQQSTQGPATATAPSTPFLSVYELAEPAETSDPTTNSYVTFLNDLYDEEIDEALFELVDEAAVLYREGFQPAEPGDPRQARRVLEDHFAPLVSELEAMFDRLAGELGTRDPSSLNEHEVEELVDGYQPASQLPPSFEHLFGSVGKLVKKVANAAKKGVGALAKLGLGPVLNKLKGLIKPLLRKVLTAAVDKLPPALQPIARSLAQRLPLLRELDEEPAAQTDASVDVTELQHEFNQQVADLVFAENEAALELELARVMAQPDPPATTLAEFERAQELFISQLGELKEGEDPTPHVESFVPALIPVIRLGFRLGGRKRVVAFLARMIGRLVKKFVGPQHAPALSQAIVDVGLRLMGLEVTADDERRAAPEAIAATVVDTVRQVAALPDQVLDDPTMLEAFALEAFEQAAAANLPPVLPDAVYRERPDLRPAGGVRGCWLPRPRYKKFSRVFATTLTPQKAEAVPTVGGATLADFLEEQLGVAPGDTVEAEVHLYESVPGTTVPDLARAEAAAVAGLVGGGEQATAQLHPLTPTAAGVLLGEPLLGRPVSAKAMGSRRAIDLGQRLYHLALPGRRPLLVPQPGGRAGIRRHSGVHVAIDFPAGVIGVRLFLGESRAQKLAVRLRQAAHPGAAAMSLNGLLGRGLRAALSGRLRGRVRLVHEALTPEQALGAGLRRLAPVATEALAGRLREWLMAGLTDFFRTQGARFVTATEDSKDGVTIAFTLRDVPGLASLRQALKGGPWTSFGKGTPSVQVDVVAGYDHG